MVNMDCWAYTWVAIAEISWTSTNANQSLLKVVAGPIAPSLLVLRRSFPFGTCWSKYWIWTDFHTYGWGESSYICTCYSIGVAHWSGPCSTLTYAILHLFTSTPSFHIPPAPYNTFHQNQFFISCYGILSENSWRILFQLHDHEEARFSNCYSVALVRNHFRVDSYLFTEWPILFL